VLFITELVYRSPRLWSHDVDQLHDLLQAVGPEAIERAFRAALDVNNISVDFVARALGRTQADLFEGRA
jgi:hypothetical protein